MGAEVFYIEAKGKNAEEAFDNARNEAAYNFGHAGYTGTIAEKDSFVKITLPKGEDPYKYADKLIDDEDDRIDDKWGPAGCFSIKRGTFFFFGWASC